MPATPKRATLESDFPTTTQVEREEEEANPVRHCWPERGREDHVRIRVPARLCPLPEFLNADLIAAGLSPFAPESQNVRAGWLLLERIRELARQRADFGFETTLSGRSYAKMLGDLRSDSNSS